MDEQSAGAYYNLASAGGPVDTNTSEESASNLKINGQPIHKTSAAASPLSVQIAQSDLLRDAGITHEKSQIRHIGKHFYREANICGHVFYIKLRNGGKHSTNIDQYKLMTND